MGNVMISLDDETEALLRTLAKERCGGKKGSLREVVKDSLKQLQNAAGQKSERQQRIDSLKELLAKGLDFDYKMYKHRSEIYG